MSITRRIAELERELAMARETRVIQAAHIRALEAELSALQSGMAPSADLADMARSDAIQSVLRDTRGTLTPTEILAKLIASGRTDDLRSVTATLNYLMNKQLVTRPDRGRYLAE